MIFRFSNVATVNVWLPSWMISILNPTDGSNGLANCFSLKPLIYKRLSKIEDALHYSNTLPHHLVNRMSCLRGGLESFRDL